MNEENIQAGEDNQLGEIQNDDGHEETVEDANANQITKEKNHSNNREHGSPLPPLVSHSEAQERIIIWGTHAQSEDPELEEFELLECQELETFIVEEEGIDMSSVTSRKRAKKLCDRTLTTTSVSATVGSPWKDHNKNHSVDGDANENSQPLDLRTSSSRSGVNRTLREARSGSESNVFSSSLSAVTNLSGSLASALDSAGRTQPLSSQSIKSTSGIGRNQQPSYIHSERNRELPRDLDQNHNSTTLPQESQYDRSKLITQSGVYPSNGALKVQKFPMEAEQNGRQGMSTEAPKGMVRVLPSCRQLVRPLSTEKRITSGYPSLDTQADQQQYHSSETDHSHQQVLPTTEVCSKKTSTEMLPNQTFTRESQHLKRQSSADRVVSPSSLERKTHFSRRTYSSPTRPSTPLSPKTTRSPQRQPPSSPIKTLPSRAPQLGYAMYSSGLRAPVKTTINTSIHNPLPTTEASMETSPPSKCPPKPKSVRPKIITYIRKTPQVKPQSLEGTYEVSSLPTKLSTYSNTQAKPAVGEQGEAAVLSASNLLYDKYRQEMQKVRFFSPGLMVSGIKPPSNTLPQKMAGRADSFYGSLNKPLSAAVGRSPVTLGSPVSGAEDPSGPLFRPPRGLRPQLGVGAVNRTPSAAAKNRMVQTGHPKSPLTFSQPMQAVNPTTQTPQEPQDQRKTVATGLAAKSFLPKPAQTGLRPPGYSRLPPARLAAFGFVRSSSVSSVSSNHSTDSTRSDPCRPAFRPNSINDEPPFHRVTTSPPGDGSRAPCRSNPQPPNTPAPTRRSILPPSRSSPVASRKEFQKSSDGTRSSLSSPKRLAVVSPKPQSPVLQRQQKATVAVRGSSIQIVPRIGSPGPEKKREEEQKKEKERDEVERHEELQLLQGRYEEQAKQLQALHTELKKTSLGLEVFVICTQHFSLKCESAEEKERELSQELSRIQHEVAFNAARWERLQKEKRELEECFEKELRELQVQQESELVTLEENLRLRHASDRDHLRAEHQSEVEEFHTQHQEQIEELTANHEAALEDLKTMHNITMSTLQEEHARTMRDLRKAHEQQKANLEEDFEKLRLSLQDQVDTLTFQNRTLKDKAKRFEEALSKSTDEQIVDALAPYQHIEEDLKSLKEVLEMKNQQIHDQEKKICHLEKVAQKNLHLEERVQVLQQQNEDLMARIDRHLSVSRQLSEENANLQENVEKETSEKKRLSRNNEELLWLLQTSPHLSPSSSPIHRAFFPGPDIPSYPYSPGPGTPTHSYSPGHCTPTHKVASPGPGTPTLRGSPTARSSPARIPNANTLPR
ncbi:microtubule-associated tumor suppressor candidate 2 isoform X2 [Pimephales promelas]|uniref:microtubule-associated tumor suppressor candidate 2 isoform X2 n=1 Tax=Pimephales promelas TaxID=90988 RepID=UPI001955590C|nr:microtubule-associated tumor suppressor candidate 2 isoform X2 [Pimephales promelas]KAG1970619.1 microtubule-associated tumor suppressor [Pimephales promelas]